MTRLAYQLPPRSDGPGPLDAYGRGRGGVAETGAVELDCPFCGDLVRDGQASRGGWHLRCLEMDRANLETDRFKDGAD